jgi:hypothetical protein
MMAARQSKSALACPVTMTGAPGRAGLLGNVIRRCGVEGVGSGGEGQGRSLRRPKAAPFGIPKRGQTIFSTLTLLFFNCK